MEYISLAIDFLLHMDKYLSVIIQDFGLWSYLILFVVIFIETGLVVTPFLPGDSLLFAAGAFAAAGAFNPLLLFALLATAAVLGDTANYWIGHAIGPRVFTGDIRFLKKEYLDKTQAFYEKYGGKTIFLARFIPIIRTFAPFVAGVGKMRYGYFISYNIIGGIVWTALCIFGGYFFGNLPFVKDNFSIVIMAIIVISVMPAVFEYIKGKRESKIAAKPAQTPGE
ncbi:MAG: DedA family protein [Leptolinea sp.]|jgi:membrane-associated protein|nr:DedA family protein [Leptolinea sp.]